jgi:hypothetical protein
VIFREGDPGDLFNLVGEGSVKISKLGRSGEQEALGSFKQEISLEKWAMLDGEPRSAVATTAESPGARDCLRTNFPSHLQAHAQPVAHERISKARSSPANTKTL